MSIKSISLMSIVGWASLGFGAITTSFEGGLPSNWTIASQWKTAYFEGTKYLCSNIAQSKSGTSGLAKLTTSVDEDKLPICNNVVAAVVLSNTMPSDLSLVDELQVVVSTNNWVSSIPVGKPFKYYDSNTSASWRTNNVYASIAGLVNCREFYFGIKVIAAGWSSNNIFIKALTVDFLAGATCTDIHFLDDKKPQIGDENSIIAATINKEPETAISDLTVWAEIKRNGFVYTNQMFEAEAGIFTNDVLKVDSSNIGYAAMPPIDAGDNLKVDVFTKYASSMGAIGEPDGVPGRYIEKSMAILSYTVPQLGSVWINEFSLDKVELCGTINRSYIQGWALELVDSSLKVVGRKEFGNSFNFKTNMPNKMIGLLTYDLGWEIKELNNPYSLRLINAAGVVEHPIEDLNLTVSGSVFGKTGIATWPEQGTAYDWSGTATNDNIFAWGKMDSASFGRVNEGQIFEIENKGWFQAQALASAVKGLSEGLEFANVSYEIDFSSGKIGASKQTDANGLIPVTEFSGAHTNEEFVIAKLAVSAFGWEALPEFYPLLFGVTNYNIAVTLTPAIARDYFSTGRIESYWKNAGTRNFNYASSGGNGYARFDSRQATAEKHYAELRCQNPIRTRGKGLVAISFSVRNDLTFGVDLSDFAYIQIATNKEFSAASVVADSMAVSNKIVGVNTGVWNTGLTFVRLPDSVSELTPLYAKIRGEAGGWSSVYLDVDDIRIAFQDMVEINDLRLTGEGKNIGFEIDAEPLCADGQSVSNVSAQVVMDVGGTVFTNFWTSKSGAIATNLSEAMTFKFSPEAISAGLMAVRGYPLREHETFKYWAQVTYYADSRDTDSAKEWETRYFPDNMTRESEDRWTVRGKYAIDMTEVSSHYTYSVPGGPISQNEGVELFVDDPTKAKFSVRAFDETGVGITNVTVRLSTAGEEDKVFTTNVTGDICFDYDVVAMGLAANAKYVVSVTGVNANGQQLTQDPFVFEFETLPEMPTAAIEAVSTSELKLTVSGKAAGYVVDTVGWAQSSANTWVKGKRSPNTLLEETILIYGTNQLGAVSATNAFEAACYTLAAVATKAPVIQKGTVTVEVAADQDYVAGNDDNPELTEYAVRVTTSDGGDALVTTNGVEVWKTLADWKSKPVTVEKPTIDLLATNSFSFITRNFDKTVSPNDSPVTTNCTFDMTAEVAGAEQAATFGKVDVALKFSDPAQSDDARAEVEYKIVGKGDWASMESFDVPFDAIEKSTNITWDAWTAVGETEGTYEYLLRAKVTDAAHGRSSGWVEMKESGKLDFVKPTVTLTSDTPDPFPLAKSPMKVEVKFSKPVTGFTKDSLLVVNGTAKVTGEGDTYTVSVTPKNDGVVTVQVLADKVVDQFGNKNKASDPLSRTFDTTPPVIHSIEGEPREMAVTNGTGFAFTALATDESMPLKYHWATNDIPVLDNTTSALTGEDALEGTNVVTVFAEDNAGNLSMKAKRTWVVDTIAPTKPEIDGKPAKFTNVPAFSMTASSVDATRLTYHWTFNNADFTGATLAKTAREGENAVRVYATDEAGNVSPTNSYSWTLDTLKPTDLKIDGDPQEGVVTNGTEFAFTASASDATELTFHWTTNGVPVADYTAAGLSGTAIEGTNTVSVYAKDAAGNACDPTKRTWVVDTIAPTKPEISGKPAALTNEVAFSMTASSEDATRLTYHWTFNDEDFTGATLAKTAREGENAVRVYATDEAGNVSPTNFWNWVVDTQPPTDPVITGTPAEGSITNVKAYDLTAASTDEHLITYHWTLGARKVAVTNFVGTAEDGDGTYTASVYATDAAGNVSGTTTWTWTLDTTAPTDPVISGTPANGSVTNEPNFNLTAAATDATLITYHWLTNGVAAADATNLVGKVEEEGLFEVKCYATDAAGNISETNDWSWTFDRTPPTKPVITDNLKKGAITNVEAYDLTAASTDEHLITYHWTLGEKKETVTNFVGSVTSSGEYTDFTAFVYATDEAGNVSETSSISWRLDTKRPTVTLTSTASGHFNRKAAPMEVTATFSEEVTNFTYECVTVDTGWASNEIVTVEAKKVFKFWVYPKDYGVPLYIDEETVSVSIDENKVWDYAGNGNEASLNEQGEQAPLTRVYDTKSPIVTLSSETPDNFNASFVPLKVTIGVTGKGVTELLPESIVITNGVVAKFEKTDEKQGDDGVITEKTYALEVTPTKEALITVVVPESVLTNMTGNTNPASEPPVLKTYDNTAPRNLAINGEPSQNKVTAATTFNFEATADDLTAMKFHWTLNGVAVTDNETSKYSGTVEKGTNWVTVSATDAAGNTCAEVKRTWVVDFEPPENLTLSGTPGKMDEIVVTNGTDFAYVAHATDDTKISYHWTTNGVEVVNNLSTNLVGIAIEGTNTVSVYATDEADNVSEVTNSVTWVVDTIPPTKPEIGGADKPAKVTRSRSFSLTASSEDATKITYHWALMKRGEDTASTGDEPTFVRSGLADGEYTVSVYATDEADNVSLTNSYSWTIDNVAPDNLKIEGTPAETPFVTTVTEVDLTASATDNVTPADKIAYTWDFNEERGIEKGANLNRTAIEGTNTATVCATDEAGNESRKSRTWVVDTHCPTNLHFVSAFPGEGVVTNGAAFAFVVAAEDATRIIYHWLTNGVAVANECSAQFGGMAVEGTNAVSVYAEDEAHNVSTTNTIRWILDTVAPTKPVIDGTPKPKAVTNDKAFSFSATAEDKTALTFFWTVDEQKMTAPAFAGEVDGDGEHTVSVYAADAAGNVSPTNTFSWTLDTIAPDNLVITGTPADGSATNKPNYSLSATAEDATTLTFHWTLGDKTEAVTNFIGEVEEEGAYEVTCYATDAAGNSSVTNSWRWTFDMTPPTLPVISGTPANGSVTNKPNYNLTAAATDNLTVITYHWMTNGVAAADVTNFVGEVNAEGVYVVSCYATDAADNVSATNVWSWTFDKTPPAALAISGKPEEGDVVATNGFTFAASATDLTRVSYRWTLNGSGGATGENFIGNAPEGTNTVSVTATDEAGNVSAVSRTWVVDTLPPTNLHFVVALPGDKVYTNDVNFAYMAVAEDATEMTFQWTLDDGAAGVRALPMDVAFTNDAPLADGEHTVSVYAEDEAGNVSVTNSATWTVDLTPPTVTLSTETSEDHVINRTDVFKVTVAFSEAVAGFMKESVTVSNGTVTNVAASAENAYDVWIAPTADGDITVQIEANKVKDLAGNGNVASEPLTRTCDITPPSVTLSSNIKIDPFGPNDLIGNPFTVTVTFSEMVTNFTASSVTVSNCTVKSVSPLTGAAKTYTVVIEPPDHDDVIAISIAGGAVTDLAGNGNTASDVLTRKYDRKQPTKPVITGTPANGSTTGDSAYALTASSEDFTDVTYFWSIDGGASWRQVTNFTGVVVAEGKHTVQVYARDKVLNKSEVASWSWTYKSGATPEGVSFGDSVQLKIADVSVTNVEFTAVDFQPGEESTFSLREFELKGSQATSKEITDLKMWFIVGTNVLDYVQKRTWPVKVDENADFDAGTLTVTIPGDKTTDQNTGKPFETFFIFGIDNKGSDE